MTDNIRTEDKDRILDTIAHAIGKRDMNLTDVECDDRRPRTPFAIDDLTITLRFAPPADKAFCLADGTPAWVKGGDK